MNTQNEFSELIRFSGSMEAEPLVMLLRDSDVTFKLSNPPHALGPLVPSSQAPVVVHVLNDEIHRAKELLVEYRKTQGVPFS